MGERYNKMDQNRKTAIIVGVLFIIATAAGALNVVILGPILEGPDYLTNVSVNENQVEIGALLDLIMICAIVGIPAMLFPILKKVDEALALGYVVARIIEVVPFVVGVVSLLSLLTVSQEFVIAEATDASRFQALGTLLLTVSDWTFLIGSAIFFSITALILNYLLYQSKLVPRLISAWGLIGGILWLAGGLLTLFGIDQVMFLAAPIAVQEMVFAVWLIIKGFNPSTIDSMTAKADVNETR